LSKAIRMSKPSRFPALAGTVAGLLAAALGAWYLYPGHFAGHSGPGTTPAAPTAARPQATIAQATERLLALPELRAQADAIERQSGGTSHGGVMENGTAPRVVDGKPYYELTFIESAPEQVHRIGTFLVSAVDDDILVQDEAADRLLTLDEWRRARKAGAR
jgi:hypothetical protein